ncbi:MAG TPA: HAD family hydrolase [Rugosimonospora sp.]|nr:HAD family hydrolase [Rugosimonospora sp.]
MPGAVLIDLFNTLIDDGGGAARDAVTREMGTVLGVDPDAFVGLFHARWRARLTGAYGPLDAMLRDWARELGGSPDGAAVTEAVRLRVALTGRLLAGVRAGTLDALDSLRDKGFRLALVTNCTVETPLAWHAGPLAGRFDATAFSCELRVGKPDPAIYEWAAGAVGVPPHECVYLGDGADGELAGAAALGMRAVRTTEYADSDPAWTGPTIATLAGLLDILEPAGEPATP